MGKRSISPLDLPDVAPGVPPTGAPEITLIKPTELLVDDAYQRNLSDKSLTLIRRIVSGWDWRRFKPPVAAWTDDGLEVIDGQHTALAAASHPAIDRIPVVIVDAVAQQDRASAFIGHNRDRIGITAAQIHVAATAAGDPEAVAVDRACAEAGIRILRAPPSRGDYPPNSTQAIGAISALVQRRGPEKAAEILKVLAGADLRPISVHHIRAVEAVLVGREYADQAVDPVELAKTVAAKDSGAEQEAKLFAHANRVPIWRALAASWFKRTRMARRPAKGFASDEAPAPSSPAGHAPAPKPVVPPPPAPEPDEFTGAKRDARPPRFAWEPGALLRRCASCGARFVGGPRAGVCADCAYGGPVHQGAPDSAQRLEGVVTA